MSARPNILVICTDQHRYDVISTHPGSVARTPHLQRLADQGAVFEGCYAPSPVCAPTRASLLTGQYPSQHGLWSNGVTLPEGAPLVSRELADAGYRCGLVGKLHLAAAFQGTTEQRLDDGFEDFRWAHDPFHGSPENAYHRWLRERHPALWEKAVGDVVTPEVTGFTHADTAFDGMPTEAHYSTWVTEETEDFIRRAADDERPFFLVANFFDPHHPFVAPSEYLAAYPPGSVPPPVGGPSELDGKPDVQRDASCSSYVGHGPSFPDFDEQGIDEIRRTYYAMVSLVDDCVGRILATLDAAGLADDTLVIFTSDHGEMLGDHAMLLKGPMMYDPAVRVPMIIRWPGRLSGGVRVEDGFVGVHDVAATVRRAAGLAAVPLDQGFDLVDVARGETAPRGYALSQYRNAGYPYEPEVLTTMLRTSDHKIVVWHGAPATDRQRQGELYDLANDPDELVNLWDVPEHATVKARLLAEFADVLVSLEDRTARRVHPW
ncbi:sulfatase-like hydrolase/transferase [Phytohabitans kaempferiae]|uniref:Sulfatase-like hydrolase/transferase n=1 Tax=Phytohabitans kaempferiae TaxID=1620943 RepID=A0ABV6LY07_9ACTN